MTSSSFCQLVADHRQRPLTCLGDASEVFTRPSNAFYEEMPLDHPVRPNARKWWEWGYIAECAELTGLLNGDKKGIGLGVGVEPLMFHFANRCEEILATDLYAAETMWKEAQVPDTETIFQESPIALKQDNLRIANGDMRDLPVKDKCYDFAWSCSSIEHIDTLMELVRIFEELARILRPGGVALLTTEFCLSESPYLLPGVNALDRDLFNTIVASNPAFQLIGDTDFQYRWEFPGNGIKPRRDLAVGMQRLNQGLPTDLFRNRAMAAPVGMSVIAPIAFTLVRTESPALTWESVELSPDIRAYSDAVSAKQAGNLEKSRRALRRLLSGPANHLTPQFESHIRKNLVEVMALQFEADKVAAPDLYDEARALVDCASVGLMADGDCLHLAGAILEGLGYHDEAVAALQVGADSASTLTSAALAMETLAACIEAAEGDIENDRLRRLILDLFNHGYHAGEICNQIQSTLSARGFSPGKSRKILQSLSAYTLAQSPIRYNLVTSHDA